MLNQKKKIKKKIKKCSMQVHAPFASVAKSKIRGKCFFRLLIREVIIRYFRFYFSLLNYLGTFRNNSSKSTVQ